MPRPEIIIRMAKNDDGDAVAALMKKADFFQWDEWEIDWHDLEPNWLAAEIDGELVGVIQVVPARPIGRVEVLTIDPDLSTIRKYRIMKALTQHAMAVVKMYGAQAVSGIIPYRYKDYLHGSQKRGWWEEIDSGAIVMGRLA